MDSDPVWQALQRAVGHFLIETDLNLSERSLGLCPEKSWDWFYTGEVCNPSLAKVYSRSLFLHSFVRILDEVNRKRPGGEAHYFATTRRPEFAHVDFDGLIDRSGPHVTLTKSEHQGGQRLLGELGIPPGQPYICVHGRDEAYCRDVLKADAYSKTGAEQFHRNFPFEDFAPAIRALIDRGYWVVRMGQVVDRPFVFEDPRFIDYASSGRRSDFLDVYLPATCRFFLGNSSGLYFMASLFRRPMVRVNAAPIAQPGTGWSGDTFIAQHLRSETLGRRLTLSEMLYSDVGHCHFDSQLEDRGLTVEQNSPAEICAAACEMDDRLAGRWRDEAADLENAALVKRLFEGGGFTTYFNNRISASFLRSNPEVLMHREPVGPPITFTRIRQLQYETRYRKWADKAA